MKLSILQAGYCTHPEHVVIRGGARKDIRFPAMFALLEHPGRGPMLFDTGYSEHFFSATRTFPYGLYARITPVFLEDSWLASSQLKARGIAAKDIETVFISHFHADHIAALHDFHRAQFVFFASAFEAVRGKKGFAALLKGFLPSLLPQNFAARVKPLNLSQRKALSLRYHPFKLGIDVLGDESLIAVELPGHAAGQMGLFVQTSEQLYFLVADACWLKRSYQENILPRRRAQLIFDDARAYRKTLATINQYYLMHPEVQIIPSHCQETLNHFL
ncbi:MAG: MBL fold metallo-hydrolase [Trueperaceae bacterium]|nr:MBL fold metallo-hydrolase [Trueperaceae bacterium]